MSNTDHQAWQLIHNANILLTQAHSILPQRASNQNTAQVDVSQYNTFIKASLHCLFKVLRHYSTLLDANIQAILYYKTAQILFNETISWNMASDYCSKGIQICKRNEPTLTLAKLKLQYLNFQIQLKLTPISFPVSSSTSNALTYLNNIIKQEIPNDDSYLNIRMFFEFIKFQNFHNNYTKEKNILHLNHILKTLTENISDENYTFHKLILVHLIEYQLANIGNIDEIINNIDLLNSNVQSGKLPIQFTAISLLFNTLVSLQQCNLNQINVHVQKFDEFIKSIKLSKKSWPTKLLFNFSIEKAFFPFDLSWLSFKDFTIISYFYTAILYSFTSWDRKNKSDKLFTLINNSDSISKPSSLDNFQIQTIKSNYMKVMFSMYKLLSDFIKDKYPKDMNSLSSYPRIYNFIENLRLKKYSSYELSIYNTLIPTLKYILGMMHQRNEQFHKSLYYYLEIINSENSYNQLKLISVLNAIPILQYIIEQEKLKHIKISEFDILYDSTMLKFRKLLKIKDLLINKLTVLSQEISVSDNILLETSIKTIKHFYIASTQSPTINVEDINSKSPLLASILYLIRGYTYVSDPGLTELDNLNAKVAFFNDACKYSIKVIDNNNTNSIAKLGYFEIWKIMNKNKNFYSQDDIDHVFEKYQHFTDDNSKNKDNDESSTKRIKFI
jgi:hypothetical protein